MVDPTPVEKQQRECRERIIRSLPACYRERLVCSNELTQCTDVCTVPFSRSTVPYEPCVEAKVALALQRFLDKSSRNYALSIFWIFGYDRNVMLYFQSISGRE